MNDPLAAPPPVLTNEVNARKRADWLWMGMLWVLATAFNLFKPYRVDDPFYLAEARWIAQHPWRPMSGTVFWITDVPVPFHQSNDSTMLVPFLQAGVIRLFGEGELALHLLTAVFAAASIVLCFSLMRRFIGRHAGLATALLILSPAFIAEQNIMLDVPLLASWLAFFLAFRDGERGRNWWGAAALACLALMIKLASVALLLFLLVEAWRQRRRDRLWVLSLPVLTLAAWSAWNYWEYGGVQILGRVLEHGVGEVASGRLLSSALKWLALVGIVLGRAALWTVTLGSIGFALGVFAAAEIARRNSLRFYAWLGASTGVLFAGNRVVVAYAGQLGAVQLEGEAWHHTGLRCVFFAVGACVLRWAWQQGRGEEAGDRRLLLWLGCAAGTIVLFSPFVAGRHVLLALPPAVLLVFRRFPSRLPRLGRALVCVGAIIGLWSAFADFRLARLYQATARSLGERHASLMGAQNVEHRARAHFLGHWGFSHYAEAAGLSPYVPGQTQLREGDVVVRLAGVHGQPLLDEDKTRLTLESSELIAPARYDLLRTQLGAEGLYSVWGGLPWTLSTEPLERVDTYRVVR